MRDHVERVGGRTDRENKERDILMWAHIRGREKPGARDTPRNPQG